MPAKSVQKIRARAALAAVLSPPAASTAAVARRYRRAAPGNRTRSEAALAPPPVPPVTSSEASPAMAAKLALSAESSSVTVTRLALRQAGQCRHGHLHLEVAFGLGDGHQIDRFGGGAGSGGGQRHGAGQFGVFQSVHDEEAGMRISVDQASLLAMEAVRMIGMPSHSVGSGAGMPAALVAVRLREAVPGYARS